MLDKKDLEAIAMIVDKRATKGEIFLIDEINRTQNSIEKKIERVEQNMEELRTYYRITRLEKDNTSLLLRIIEDLRKDVEELKNKIA